MEAKNKNKSKNKGWLLILAAIFLILIILVGGLVGFEFVYANNFYPGVSVGYVSLDGKTYNQALDQLKEIEKNLQAKGLIFQYDDKEISVNPVVITVEDPDLARPILTFNWTQTLDTAMSLGRQGSWWNKLSDQVSFLLNKYQVPVDYQIDWLEVEDILRKNFGSFETLSQNAQLKIDGSTIEVLPEASGKEFDYEATLDILEKDINNLNFESIALKIINVTPTIRRDQTGSAVNSLEKILNISEIKLIYGTDQWQIEKEKFIPWLEFQIKENEVAVGFNKDKVQEYLKEIAQSIDVEAKDAKFKLEGKRVTEFDSSQDGRILNLDSTYEKLNSQIIAGNNAVIELVVETQEAKLKIADVNNLGIKELVGRGTSSFAGSPKNRRYNIGVGASSLNGILIEPGEEFSLLKALGSIDETNGYKRELVIKGDRTIPEFGGGLCQIGTTTFRAALSSGLPITVRRNHSYRVSYYEPPIGMDATIYNPSPDLKFINDTGNYILFATRIDGNNLIFEFYGTKDGRVATTTEPVVYNYVKPGEPRYIETEELPPGEKKKVETAHSGVDAKFTYTVTYSNGEVKEQEFKSHYVPWKETWLVGKQPTTTPEVAEPLPEPAQ